MRWLAFITFVSSTFIINNFSKAFLKDFAKAFRKDFADFPLYGVVKNLIIYFAETF